jgi:hypothetical protein
MSNFIDIYSFIFVSGCVYMGPNALLCPISYNAVKTALHVPHKDNGKEPWDMSIEWTSPDVTIPSQFISSLDDTPTSVGSTTLEVRNFMWYMQGRLNSII